MIILLVILSLLAPQPYSEIVKREDWKQQRVECLVTLGCLEIGATIVEESVRYGLPELAEKEVKRAWETVLRCNCREYQLLLFPLFENVSVDNYADRVDSARVRFRMLSHEVRHEMWKGKQFRSSS